MTLEDVLLQRGFTIILPNITVDQIIAEEHSSHQDGSKHEFDFVLTLDGIIEKCSFCGMEKQERNRR